MLYANITGSVLEFRSLLMPEKKKNQSSELMDKLWTDKSCSSSYIHIFMQTDIYYTVVALMQHLSLVSAWWDKLQERHTGCLVFSIFSPRLAMGLKGGYQSKNHHPSSRPAMEVGVGEGLVTAYITVAVENHIHQIKSSIYLCGSGDSGGGVWNLEGGYIQMSLWQKSNL